MSATIDEQAGSLTLVCNFPKCTITETFPGGPRDDVAVVLATGWSWGGTIAADPLNGYIYNDGDDLHFCPSHPTVSDQVVFGPGPWAQPAAPYLLHVEDFEQAYLITADLVPVVDAARRTELEALLAEVEAGVEQ